MKKKIVTMMLISSTIVMTACSGPNNPDSEQQPTVTITEAPTITDIPEATENPDTTETSVNAQESDSVTNSNENISESTQNTEDIESQVSIQAIPDEDGHVAVFMTNNSTSIIDELDAQILYKDATGTTIDMDEDFHDMVLPGSTVVSQMGAPDSYDNFETSFTVETGIYPTYENHAADVQINANQGEDCVIIEITNTGSVDIEEIEYIVLLYRGDTLVSVGYSQDIYDVKAGQTVTEKENTYGKEYDRFEVYLNQAHTFGL